MRSRRRRKARPLWFPPLGTPFTVGDDTTVFGGVTFSLVVPGDGSINFTEIPLTFDFGQEAILADAQNQDRIPTLADLQSSAWRLRRAVGKVFATYHIHNSGLADPQQNQYPAVAFAAGLMVRKVNEFSAAVTNVDPVNRDDYDDPWIWRRMWLLGQNTAPSRYQSDVQFRLANLPITSLTPPTGNDEFAAYARFPNSTAHYGSVMDGPHVDAKTNRLIGPEDRLFLSLAVKGMPIQPDQGLADGNGVFGLFDFRYLGFLARASNRRNASR